MVELLNSSSNSERKEKLPFSHAPKLSNLFTSKNPKENQENVMENFTFFLPKMHGKYYLLATEKEKKTLSSFKY